MNLLDPSLPHRVHCCLVLTLVLKRHSSYHQRSQSIAANGIIKVSATDKGTGKSHDIRIEASSGLTAEEIERMKKDAENCPF